MCTTPGVTALDAETKSVMPADERAGLELVGVSFIALSSDFLSEQYMVEITSVHTKTSRGIIDGFICIVYNQGPYGSPTLQF